MELRGKRILVTGSSGFVGARICRKLEAIGALPLTMDLRQGDDVTDRASFARLGEADLCLHLASVAFVPFSWENPAKTYEVNVLGTLNLLEFCRRTGAGVVFASSYLYGKPRYLPVDEKHPLRPTNPYAASKAIAEQLCEAYHRDFGIACVILRVFNLYGKGQDGRFLIPEIINQIKTEDVITLRDLTPRRDLLHVDDAVDAYMRAAEFEGADFEVFNIGYGESYSVLEIAEKLVRLSGSHKEITSLDQERQGEISETVADISKAQRLLEWKPQIGIDEGLEKTLR
jgi:nucleoside-diphosphate-sugar epimerase